MKKIAQSTLIPLLAIALLAFVAGGCGEKSTDDHPKKDHPAKTEGDTSTDATTSEHADHPQADAKTDTKKSEHPDHPK
jgi:hypothetical protein